jgi:very-short-patch-repair endonuclease
MRNGRLGEKFRRQHPVDSFIVDFICLKKRLIVELDGGYHDTIEQKMLDEERTRILNSIGFSVYRFTNAEVLNDIDCVIRKIMDLLLNH